MAEIWRYQDRLAARQLLLKHTRNEFGDVPPHGAAGYGRVDIRSDERDARALDFGLDYSKFRVDYSNDGAAFGSAGITGGEITGLADGTLLGGGVTRRPGPPIMGLSVLEDPRISGMDPGFLEGASASLNGARSDIASGKEFPEAISRMLSHPLASSGLYVEGLPLDCSRREASHIFRRFRGYKEVRVNRKGKGSKKSNVLYCFVDFEDPFSAARALEALRGYRFDEDDPEAEPLQIQFSTRGPRSGPPAGGRHHKRRRR